MPRGIPWTTQQETELKNLLEKQTPIDVIALRLQKKTRCSHRQMQTTRSRPYPIQRHQLHRIHHHPQRPAQRRRSHKNARRRPKNRSQTRTNQTRSPTPPSRIKHRKNLQRTRNRLRALHPNRSQTNRNGDQI